MQQNYQPPCLNSPGFHCPHCQTYAHQQWYALEKATDHEVPEEGHSFDSGRRYYGDVADTLVCQCSCCDKYSIWVNGNMVYPDGSHAPPPTLDMPWDVKQDYQEAASIVRRSPRAAAALLRLALQKLMPHLGEKGEKINTDVANLVKKGLQPDVQKALDTLRVVGNNAVHPGELSTDNQAVAHSLFGCLNYIVEAMIAHPKKLNNLYLTLPQTTREAIQRRDSSATT
jgi:Domain of unknown function (DUF4145)